MNNKGFTLIELLATIMLLAVIMSVTAVSIISIIGTSKQKSFDLLVEDIKIAAQGYFEECEYSHMLSTPITCPSITNDDITKTKTMTLEFEDLLDYGFLKATDTSGTNKKILNPNDNSDMGCCKITIQKKIDSNLNVTYSYVFPNSSACGGTCPTS